MRLVHVVFLLVLSVFLLATLLSCQFLFDFFFCEPDEDCVTGYVINSSSRQVEVYSSGCCERDSISPGQTAGISVLLGSVVTANGQSHVFREAYERWEIW
ncbi:hypothetical protein ES708_11267 [subsurface metagenome]